MNVSPHPKSAPPLVNAENDAHFADV